MDEYLALPTRKPGAPHLAGTSEVVVEAAHAPSVFAEAVQVLRGKPTEAEVRQAWEDLDAACDAPFQQACDFLREQFKGPKKIEGDVPRYPSEAILERAFAMVVIRCRLGVDGKLRACEVLEAAPYGFTEAMVEALRGSRYQPASLAGHPIEISYTLTAKMSVSGIELTPEEQLKWVRMRAEAFPWSVSAWFGLASTLARHAPEDPAYLPALRHLNELDPYYWWSANELAWMHVQAGRYAEAARLARRAREAAPRNSYVLETSAATLFGLGQCEEAMAEQHHAAEGLPDEWPAPEQARFLSTLREYTQRCTAGAPPVPAAPPR
jgi:tetratricopeptide (TPR) repeat protein